MKKRILYVCHEFYPMGGGGEVASYKLLCQLQEDSEFEFEVLSSYDMGRGTYPQEIKGVLFHTVPIIRRDKNNTGLLGMLMFVFQAIIKMIGLLRSKEYHLIHYWYSIPSALLSFLHQKKVPYMITHGGGDIPHFNPGQYEILHKIMKPINKRIVKNSNMVISMSRYSLQYARKQLDFEGGKAIYNASDDRGKKDHYQRNDGRLKIITVARLIKLKKIDLLIQAMEKIDNALLTVIGTGPEEEYLKKLAAKLGSKVKFLGGLENNDVYEVLKKSDLFVLLTVGDSFGIVFAEAMSCGLPVIGARAGGVPEIIQEGINGFLVEPNNLESIIEAIKELQNNPNLREEFGENGYRIFNEKFRWEIIVSEYLSVYRDLIKN